MIYKIRNISSQQQHTTKQPHSRRSCGLMDNAPAS